ncbi:MAG: sigma 54-interacting transcriptional regulator [Desulfobulbaceae bacterium]|nr:sigma 54-interacting transcriptional regulator [Desulfobulbaceae bacterium]
MQSLFDYEQAAVKRAWNDFVTNREVNPSDVKDYVLRGWQLSQSYGINPDKPSKAIQLSREEFNELKLQHSDMLDAANTVLKMIEISLREPGFIVTVTAYPGYLLMVSGADKELNEADRKLNRPGVLRSVEQVGASALSLSMLENKPVEVCGLEHYNQQFKHWTCASAPIHDTHGNVVGSLTVSGHLPNKQSHTLALVTAAASSISTQLREKSLIKEQARLNSMLLSTYNSITDGVIAVKKDLNISHANYTAKKLMGVDDKSVESISLNDLLNHGDKIFIDEIFTNGLPQNRELSFKGKNSNQKFLCRFLPISSNDSVEGLTIIITNKKQLIDIAKRVGGNYAKYEFSDIKGSNAFLLSQIELTKKAAKTSSRILLTGEGGTGKELFAQAIHNHSAAKNGPFVAVSCAAIPRDLIESELFGYVGGAFTGARSNGMIGKFELAASGTLFLDEINSLPLEMQVKLLRALQQNEVVRIGDTRPTQITARVITATNINLMDAIKAGDFREDLYYRLNVIEITIPPLRKRADDIITLAEFIISRHCNKSGRTMPSFSENLTKSLQKYSWPGNVRELENLCERALLLSTSNYLDEDHFPSYVSANAQSREVNLGTITDHQKDLIQRTIRFNKGNISKAAKELGVARTTLYRSMRKYNIQAH